MTDRLEAVFELYEQNLLEQFLEQAEDLLDKDISRWDRVRLLTMMGLACADPSDTVECFDMANREFEVAKALRYPDDPADETTLDVLRSGLQTLQGVIMRESSAAAFGEMDEDDEDDENEELAVSPTSDPQLDGRKDTEPAGDERELAARIAEQQGPQEESGTELPTPRPNTGNQGQ